MQRRSRLQSKTPLRQGTKGLTTRRPLERRTPLRSTTPLKLVSDRTLVEASDIPRPELAAIPPRRNSTFRQPRGSSFRSCSPAQREAVKGKLCIACGGARGILEVDPAHLTPQGGGWGGCESPLCVVPLCRICHDLFDGRVSSPNDTVDLAPVLALPEWARHRAHMAEHMDYITALQRLSGTKYAPVGETTLMGAPMRGPEGTAA